MPTKKTTKKRTIKTLPKQEYCRSTSTCNNTGGCAYFLGFLGAAIYYISVTTGFWAGLLGVFKALIWPVFLVHGLLKLIGA